MNVMRNPLEPEIEFLCEDLFERGRNHLLLYGKPEDTLSVLKSVYERATKRGEFLCSWHDASTITCPMNFFEPVLQLKYGEEYNLLREKLWFKDLVARNDRSGVFQLAGLCGREKASKNPNARRLPLFFIDGIEELFFKLDYGHLDEESRKNVLSGDFMDQHFLPRGFGDCLRSHLHQTGTGIFYGTVRNSGGIQFQATLGNYYYLFYDENFMNHTLFSFRNDHKAF